MSNQRLFHSILLVMVALLGTAWIVQSKETIVDSSQVELPEAPMVGSLAPDFIAQTPTGQSYTLTEIVERAGENGRPVVLNFWASWCGPCRIETPHFQRASLKYNNRVTFLGINQGEEASTITEFGVSYGLTYPLLVDTENAINNLYAVLSLPTTIFIDRHGVVTEVYYGAISQGVLEAQIGELINE